MKIVLAHGVLGFGDELGSFASSLVPQFISSRLPRPLSYFNGIAAHLEKQPDVEKVYAWSVSFKGSIEARGKQLATKLATIKGPVHVIAHSMGGLDARWALSNDKARTAHVKSLTTIGTPHYGSEVADAISAKSGPLAGLVPQEAIDFLNAFAPALRDLTTEQGRAFDAATKDRTETNGPRVDYREIYGDASLAGSGALLYEFAKVVERETNQPNDGMVTKNSALRGRTKSPFDPWPFDHAGEVGWKLGFASVLPYYDAIVGVLRTGA